MNTVSREKPRRVPTIARSYIRLKLKTSIEREREEESVKKGKRDKREETVGNKKKKIETKYERIFCIDCYSSPRVKEAGRNKHGEGTPGVLALLSTS